jgi:hypothetical protein
VGNSPALDLHFSHGDDWSEPISAKSINVVFPFFLVSGSQQRETDRVPCNPQTNFFSCNNATQGRRDRAAFRPVYAGNRRKKCTECDALSPTPRLNIQHLYYWEVLFQSSTEPTVAND